MMVLITLKKQILQWTHMKRKHNNINQNKEKKNRARSMDSVTD